VDMLFVLNVHLFIVVSFVITVEVKKIIRTRTTVKNIKSVKIVMKKENLLASSAEKASPAEDANI
jgi:hypothetical protein